MARARRDGRAEYANGARRRAEIVDAAFRVFAEQGYDSSSLRSIGVAAGTSHVSLIHHFGTKEALLEAVLAHREELDRPVREEIIRECGLVAGATEMMRRNSRLRGVIHLDARLAAEAIDPGHPAHDFFARRFESFVAAVVPQLELEVARGTVRPGLPLAVVARQLSALMDGLQVQWLYDPAVDIAEHVAGFLALLAPVAAPSQPPLPPHDP